MALNIDGTTGISGVDGSASAPALQGTDSNTGINFASDTVNINTGGVTRATVDSNGRLGIGTTSPSSLLELSGGGNATLIVNTGNNSGDNSQIAFGDSADADVGFINYDHGTNAMQFRVNASECFRVDSGGKLLVGTTSGTNFSNNVAEFLNTNADAAVGVRSTYGASNQNYITFQYGGGPTACGGIRRDGTNNSPEFFSSSDRRIKTNILDMDNTLDKINQLSLKKFNFKLGGSGVGVIAQDLINIFPNKVKKDDSDDGTGDTVPDGVDPWTVGNNFTYELLKAVQELSAKVETLETKVAALEAG
tara:strand:+ start:150 stop:1067 length:918 start_codon:yes stop_codon:yes gene_type:complete